MVVDDHDARHGSITNSTSVPVPGVLWIVARAAVTLHASDYRVPDAAAVGRRGLGVESGPAVAHEDLGAAVLDLGVERDRLGAGELRRVHQRLAGGGDQRARALVERPVAHGHDLDRHVVVGLDLGRRGLQRARERRRAGGARVVQPGAQLAFLAAGQGGDLARVVGALLHQRERLQDGVVQVRGDLGALLRADPRRALGGQAADEPDPPGARMIVTAISTTATGRITSRAGASESLRERKSSAPPITSAAPTPARLTASRGIAARAAAPRCSGRGLRLAPDQRAARPRDHQRPGEAVAEPDAPLAQHQRGGERQAADPRRHQPGVAAVEQARDDGALRPLGRDQRPADGVERDARAAGQQGQGEPDPDQQRIDPEAGGEPGADAADVPGRARRRGTGLAVLIRTDPRRGARPRSRRAPRGPCS